MEPKSNDNTNVIENITDKITGITKQASYASIISEYQEKEFLKELHELINKNPKEFRHLVCNWVLESDESNKQLMGLRRLYGYLATLVINKIDKKRETLVGYVSAKKWIENEFHVDYPLSPSCYKEPDLNHILYIFFRRIADDLNCQTGNISYMVYFGLPLYEYDEISNKYTLLAENTELYAYLKLRGKYSENSYSYSLPEWANNIYINIEHIDWYYKLDNYDSPYPENESVDRDKIKAAYRQVIGVPLSSSFKEPSYGKKTKLYKLMLIVIDRYYGSQFDINDSDTWPKQATVVEWLKNAHDLSAREAIAIDLITRPDEARNK